MSRAIQDHNERAATVWNSGGAAYDAVSHQISAALEHCVTRLDPLPNERVLDLATGTGWTSRLLARRGARVTGIDIAADLLASARTRAAAERLDIAYRLEDAEALSSADAAFDVVASTFGVMFAGRPEAAAAEMARVCRKGGRLGLVTWTPDGTVFEMFKVMRAYMPPPAGAPPPSPFAWGQPERLRALLGDAFDLRFEPGACVYYDCDGEAAWEVFVNGYGPTKALAGSLDPDRRADLRRDFVAFHDRFRTELGIAVPRAYLLTIGTRR
ncbi:class I SAM-dependent methyltransferase [Methylobacterium planeticum]|uniref:Class I SAM-dependent methyltransferase n=1 Tax=Methylobacterium planeticum TaxID=2615211 RepID=A0A6N6MQV6_9HYPH|nr:class I SAM-dependent methyltransferase [Methylobacterium planeticum]KAB1072744.1 class I SAM-dependent methyltransferase [Methylobacterium planeticum]